MTVAVWSERRPMAPWTQCSECSYLMGLVHGGYGAFPRGIYTDAERDAFTATEIDREGSRAAGRPMFPLLDAASAARYGVKMRTVTGSLVRATDAQLRVALGKPGNLVMIPGSYATLPAGHRLRRWQPGFTGGHMVGALVRPDRSVLWLDPLAPTGYAGDVTDLPTAMAFAWPNSDAHVVAAGELAAGTLPDAAMRSEPMLDPLKPEAWTVREGGATVFATPNGGRLMSLAAGTEITTLGEVGDPAGHRLVYVTPSPGRDVGAYVKRAEIDPLSPGGDPAFEAAVKALLLSRSAPTGSDCTALENKIRAASTAVAGARRAIRAAADSLA